MLLDRRQALEEGRDGVGVVVGEMRERGEGITPLSSLPSGRLPLRIAVTISIGGPFAEARLGVRRQVVADEHALGRGSRSRRPIRRDSASCPGCRACRPACGSRSSRRSRRDTCRARSARRRRAPGPRARKARSRNRPNSALRPKVETILASLVSIVGQPPAAPAIGIPRKCSGTLQLCVGSGLCATGATSPRQATPTICAVW